MCNLCDKKWRLALLRNSSVIKNNINKKLVVGSKKSAVINILNTRKNVSSEYPHNERKRGAPELF